MALHLSLLLLTLAISAHAFDVDSMNATTAPRGSVVEDKEGVMVTCADGLGFESVPPLPCQVTRIRTTIVACAPPDTYGAALQSVNVATFKLVRLSLRFPGPPPATLRDDQFDDLVLNHLQIVTPYSTVGYNFNIHKPRYGRVDLSSADYITIKCSDVNTLEDMSTVVSGRTVRVAELRVADCPLPRRTYAAALRALGVDVAALSELTLQNVRELTAMQVSHLAGLNKTKVLITTPSSSYQYSGSDDLSLGANVQLKCGQNGTLADMSAILPGRTVRVLELFVESCPPPRHTYAGALAALSVDVAALIELKLLRQRDALNATHFEGLSLRTLTIQYTTRPESVDENLLQPLAASLVILSVEKMLLPPLPASIPLKKVVLNGGASTGAWGGCEKLERLELNRQWDVPEVSDGWLAQCTRLRVLVLMQQSPLDVRRALAGTRSLHALTVLYCYDLDTVDEMLLADTVELRRLDMTWNGLTAIHRDAFKSLSQLQMLILKNNRLKQLSAHTLRPLQALRSLDLTGNVELDFCKGAVDPRDSHAAALLPRLGQSGAAQCL